MRVQPGVPPHIEVGFIEVKMSKRISFFTASNSSGFWHKSPPPPVLGGMRVWPTIGVAWIASTMSATNDNILAIHISNRNAERNPFYRKSKQYIFLHCIMVEVSMYTILDIMVQ